MASMAARTAHLIRSGRACQSRSFRLPDLSQLSPFAQTRGRGRQKPEDGAGDSAGPEGTETVSESIVLPYTAKTLHALVEDVPSYSSYLPFCTSSTILGPSTSSARDPPNSKAFLAQLSIGFKGFSESYTSRVVSVPEKSVEATAQSDLFEHLHTRWTFTPLPTDPSRTRVDFQVSFAFHNPLHALVAGNVCRSMAGDMIAAFKRRAEKIS
ncbi:Oligoketide cyclase/lipid transport protein [Ceraceosorus bombacis]|uniref:Oligoketide cyclase/lipid transport protein n=1 Tax=Ceraceosorus bombacis TaxID=401625 RepID=A0A0P1BDK4_9BASI|nr:Oligoketide cyclase/lipid transport protein [Ceraceosorus bombacis]